MKWKWVHHLPLSVFTLLMPAVVMVYLLSYPAHYHMNIAWVFTTVIGLSFASLHLGSPRGAMNALRHLYHSWLSREMIFFTLFLAGQIVQLLIPILENLPFWYTLVTFSGLLGVFSTVMVYRTTPRIGHWPVELDFLLEMLFCGSLFLPNWFFLIVGLKVAKDLYLSSVLWNEKDSTSLLTAALGIFAGGVSPVERTAAIAIGILNTIVIRMAFFHRLDRNYLLQSAERQRKVYLPGQYQKYFSNRNKNERKGRF